MQQYKIVALSSGSIYIRGVLNPAWQISALTAVFALSVRHDRGLQRQVYTTFLRRRRSPLTRNQADYVAEVCISNSLQAQQAVGYVSSESRLLERRFLVDECRYEFLLTADEAGKCGENLLSLSTLEGLWVHHVDLTDGIG